MQVEFTLADLLKVGGGLGGGVSAGALAWLTLFREGNKQKSATQTELSRMLMEERAQREGAIEKLQGRVTELFAEVERLREDNARKDVIIAELMETVRAKDQRIADISGELRALKQVAESSNTIKRKGLEERAQELAERPIMTEETEGG